MKRARVNDYVLTGNIAGDPNSVVEINITADLLEWLFPPVQQADFVDAAMLMAF